MSVALVVTGMSEPTADEETQESLKIYRNKCSIKVYSQGAVHILCHRKWGEGGVPKTDDR